VPVRRIGFLAGGEVVILPVVGRGSLRRVWVRIRPSSVTGRRHPPDLTREE